MELLKDTGGRPIKELTEIDAIQVEALAAVCTKSQMAAYFGMTEKTFRAVEERQPEVSTAYRTGRAKGVANIGSVLYEKALSGDIRAMQFYLKTHKADGLRRPTLSYLGPRSQWIRNGRLM